MGYVTRALTQLPFGNIIGGPMKAAIEAQALAARSTIEFIQTVGFEQQNDDALFPSIDAASGKVSDTNSSFGKVRTVTFEYQQQNVNGTETKATLTVPLLTIVPIPFLRIDEMTIDFMAKMTEEYKHKNSTNTNLDIAVNSNFQYKAFWSPVSANFNVAVSSKHSASSENSSRFSTEATMSVHVRAVQDSMPGGMAKILQILENAIKSPPVEVAPTP
jgi:Protein of unknown function (DUF2589)